MPTPSNLAIVSGDNAEGVVGAPLATPLAVRVQDSNNRPVPNVVVQFTITTGGGTLSSPTATSNGNGVASVNWALGLVAGAALAEARVQAVPTPAVFNVTVRAGAPSTLQRVSFTPGSSAAGFPLADSVAFRLTDSFGNAIPDVTLNFGVMTGGGSVAPATAITNVSGVARTSWQLGGVGPQALRAHVGAVSTDVTANAITCPENTLAPGSVLTLGPGDATCVVMGGSAARYMVAVVNAGRTPGASSGFRLRGAGAATALSPSAALVSPAPATASPLPSSSARAQLDEARRHTEAHEVILRANEQLLQQLMPQALAARAKAPSQRMNSVVAAPLPNVGDIVTLRIPTNFGDLCGLSSAANVRARAVFVGQHGVVFEDSAAALAGKLDTLFQRMGEEFDTGMWQLLNDNFGSPLAYDKQLDNNGRFFMLFSERVNLLQGGNIAGFVSSSDFFPQNICPASNLAEIFYARMPTLLSVTPGQSDAPTPHGWYRRTRTVVIHEVKHIVSYAERFAHGFVPSAAFNNADRWLEESSAMMAEELWGRTVFGYQAEANVNYRQSIYCEVRLNDASWPECPQPYKPLNIFDHFILLYDYLSNPEALSPLGAVSSGDFSFYGSGWSFLRWVIDNYASSESAFLTALTQELALPGVQNIEARTGRNFADLISNWAVALIMDDYPNFTPADPRHRLESWNSRDIFAGMNLDFSSQGFFTRAVPLTPRPATFGNFVADVSSVRGGSMSVFEVSGNQTAGQLFEFSGLAGTNFPADMRINIIRVQ